MKEIHDENCDELEKLRNNLWDLCENITELQATAHPVAVPKLEQIVTQLNNAVENVSWSLNVKWTKLWFK